MGSFQKSFKSLLSRKSSHQMEEEKKALRRNVVVTDHKVELSELLQRFEVNANVGLSTDEAKERLKEYGQNMLTPPSQTPAWIKFVRELTGFFSLLLWGGAILCFVGYSIDHSKDHLFLGIVLVFVVVVTGIFSYVQNSKSESLMNSFKNMLPPKVKVIRDGCSDEVVALNLVPGDIVFVEGGDLIPADVRVIECSDNFNVDNAALTGESEPQKRKPICTHEDPLETQNLCFFGTQVPEGSCKGIVISTGDKTVMGRIAALAMSTSNEQTPINREIHHFILIISAIAISLGVIFFLLNVYIGTPHIENLVFMIGIIVANVPEGLLATVTVCLTLTAKRMHEKKVLVKNLEGVETLGSTSCICSDKTGTLTQNIMTVARVVYGNSVACITEDAPSSFTAGNKSYDESNISFQKLSRCATLCNVATFNESSKWEVEEDGETKKLDSEGKAIPRPFSGHVVQGDGSKLETVFWKPVGNASECAMIKLVQSEANMTTGEGDVEKTRLNYPTKFVIPFNSKNKYQVHIHEEANTKKHVVMMKGAPERILNRCSHVMLNGKVVQMTEEERKNIESRQESLSAEGLRCLGFAELELDQNTYNQDCKYATDDDEYYSPNFPLGDVESKEVDSEGRQQNPKSIGGLVFLGLMALVDPPRPAVPAAVEKCKTAGVKVIMVTGDHPVTAQAIAYKVGILWSKTRGDMENDNNKFGRTPGSPDYEDPNDAQAIVVPGHTISVDMSEERWDFILNHPQIVFARTSPQQKLVIVENCQRLGHIVAVTGDGVNDSPAIKKADIGIAMGIMGSEVSKNAADMILLDDNFASIVKGVEEGRLIFDNLKKSIAYTIQSNIPEITPFLAFILFAIPLPLTTFLILAIDLGTDMIPAISMAYEYPEADIMKRPPRNSKTDRLVTKGMINFSYGQIGMIQAFAGFFTYMVVLNDYGYAPHVLPFRGNNDAWGHQPLFCKFSGGNYMNIKGEVDASRNPGEDAPSREYPFWSEGLNGKVDSCYYPGNNYSGDAALRKDFDFRDSTTYVDGTKGHRTPTLEAIEANESQRYFEYVPWKGKKSSFWNDKFLYWNTDDANIAQSIGEDIDSAVYFRSAPAGLWSLCAHEDDKCSNSFCGEDGNAKVRGIATPDYADVKPSSDFQFSSCDDQAKMTNKKYKHAQFCNGQSDDDASCQKINGYEYDSKDNIISAFPTNRYQTFYCMGYNKVDDNACGPLTDSKDDLPFCYENGDRCGTFADHSKDGCAYMCEDHCYWPGSDAINPMTQQESKVSPEKWGSDVDKREYKQCKNIASNEVAWESLKHAQGAFFSSIVVGQIAGLLVCKTRWLSITVQGMKNNFMLFGIGTEILLVAWLAYCKPLNDALGTRNIRLVHWFCAIPFAILIFVFDEGRKALMRATSYEKLDPATGQVTRVKGWLESNCAF